MSDLNDRYQIITNENTRLMTENRILKRENVRLKAIIAAYDALQRSHRLIRKTTDKVPARISNRFRDSISR